ncbi:hypothetical protein VTN31DRAFT_1085 [Thermomyces dupontii]|uniref:uncharacterized protein n=1 Tax=Talaromyces thermophilus TaxID=28565 RepID=UPI003744763B
MVPRKNTDPIAWVRQWECAMALTKECNLAQVAYAGGWMQDFGKALKAMGYGIWYESNKAVFRTQISNNTLDYREVAHTFHASVREDGLTTTAPESIMKGALVSFNGAEPSDDDSNDDGSGDESANEKKRKRSPTPPARSKKKLECAACRGRTHKTEDCYFLFPD